MLGGSGFIVAGLVMKTLEIRTVGRGRGCYDKTLDSCCSCCLQFNRAATRGC